MKAFITTKRMHSEALKRGFKNFQSLFCFVLTTDDVISATTNPREFNILGCFWSFFFFFQIIVEMVLPYGANTGPCFKISKFSALAMDLTGLVRQIILPLCFSIWRKADGKSHQSYEVL